MDPLVSSRAFNAWELELVTHFLQKIQAFRVENFIKVSCLSGWKLALHLKVKCLSLRHTTFWKKKLRTLWTCALTKSKNPDKLRKLKKKIDTWGKNSENIQKFQPRDIAPNIFYRDPLTHEISMTFYWVSTTFSSLLLPRSSLGTPFKTLHPPLYFLIILIISSWYSGNYFCNGNLFTNTNCYDKLDLNNASYYAKVSLPFILLIKWINLSEHVNIRATEERKENAKSKKKQKVK